MRHMMNPTLDVETTLRAALAHVEWMTARGDFGLPRGLIADVLFMATARFDARFDCDIMRTRARAPQAHDEGCGVRGVCRVRAALAARYP